MIVVAIAGILITLAIPTFQQSAIKAKEAALKENLFTMRTIIDQFYADRGQYPSTLTTLVDEGYIRNIPVDPMTKSDSTWQEVLEEQNEEEDTPAGVYDVHSGSDQAALDGTSYNEW